MKEGNVGTAVLSMVSAYNRRACLDWTFLFMCDEPRSWMVTAVVRKKTNTMEKKKG